MAADVSGEQAQVPEPTFSQTFRWLDGGPAAGEYGWMTDEDAFDGTFEWEPRPYVVETWERTAVEVRWAFPRPFTCSYEDDEPCDEDAVTWQQEDDCAIWRQACERHRLAVRP